MDLNDLAYRFWESPTEKLFKRLGRESRYQLDVPDDLKLDFKKFLEKIVSTCTFEFDGRALPLYRARKNDFGQYLKFPPSKMGAPKNQNNKPGRAQSDGITVLYLASDECTAISEVRPEIAELITVAKFKFIGEEKLKIVDFTRFKSEIMALNQTEIFEIIRFSKYVFSAPKHPNDQGRYNSHSYLIQELFRLGYDGVVYSSTTSKNGKCYSFFDEKKFKSTRSKLIEIEEIFYQKSNVNYSKLEINHIAGDLKKLI